MVGSDVCLWVDVSRRVEHLDVLQRARGLVDVVYSLTDPLDAGERHGLQSQARRAVLSIAANIAEGAARRSPREYARFVEIALGSAHELSVLLDVIATVAAVERMAIDDCRTRNAIVRRSLQKLQRAIRRWC